MIPRALAIPLLLLLTAPSRADHLFRAEDASGGVLVTFADKSVGVALDKSLDGKKGDVAIEWKPAQPLAPGWYRGLLEFGPREGDDRGWVNYHLGVTLASAQKPMINVMSNFAYAPGNGPATFEFFVCTSSPAPAVRLHGVYDDLWRHKRSWPVTRLTLTPLPTAAPTADQPVTLDLPVKPDGTVDLPPNLPPGVWSLRAATTKDGDVTCTGQDGKPVRCPLAFDQWKRPQQICFYMASPPKSLVFKTPAMVKGVVLEHTVVKPAKEAPVEGALITTIDPSKTETGTLVLHGAAAGAKPQLAIYPHGKTLAVVTTWDDGAPPDLRCADILARHGYRPSFFMNKNSLAMRFLDKLEALGAEVGSHCITHPTLHALPPDRALEECVGMRKILEKQLGHPVVSMAYPNGYTPAWDTEGDYALRAVRLAGHWSGRTTLGAKETVDSIPEPLAFRNNGFFGNKKDLERQWNEVKDTPGAVFHFWGHSWQIGKTDEQWKSFDDFVAQFAKHPKAWYATQGDFFYWAWLRKTVVIDRPDLVGGGPDAERFTLKRPWVHPYLVSRVPLTLTVPAGVTKATWNGKDIPIVDGRIELPW
ncbi:MAG TPA: polysaccharide deacetylase family protein [Tepidisphaeraceae bacterium]|nr:polysaccharide deacetylase family protein [Tepidisphaeraceae bacterium]